MDYLNAAPIIVAICYIVAELLKKWILNTDNKRRLLPEICSVLGIAIAIVLFYAFPELIPNCNHIVTAIITGACSGLAATGCNQIVKQIQKAYNGEEIEDIDSNNDDEENN